MVVCDSSFDKFTVPIRETIESLSADIIYFTEFTANPDYDDIIDGVKLFLDEKCDFIISVGGGSAIDVAKCIIAAEQTANISRITDNCSGVMRDNDDFVLRKELRCEHLAIPTTAGTGSEATHFAVIYKNGDKISIEHEKLSPDYVVLEPGFLETLPMYQKKSTMLDALCQAIESMWAKGSTDESYEYAKEAKRIITEHADSYIAGDKESAALMLRAANISGKAINISKTTAAHAMSYKLSTLFGIAHGHAVALCLPHVWRHYLQCTMHNSQFTIHDAQTDSSSFDAFVDLFTKLDMYCEFEYDDDTVEQLVESVNVQRLNNHPVYISKEALFGMYRDLLTNGITPQTM